MITNSQSGTNVHEIADSIYRINTPVSIPNGPGKFSFGSAWRGDGAQLLRALAARLCADGEARTI